MIFMILFVSLFIVFKLSRSQYQQFTFLKGSKNGEGVEVIAEVETYNDENCPGIRHWQRSASFDEGNQIIFFGGVETIGNSNVQKGDVWVYHLQTNQFKFMRNDQTSGNYLNQWSAENTPGTISQHLVWKSLDDEEFYIFGGAQNGYYSNDLWLYSILRNQYRCINHFNAAEQFNDINSDPNLTDRISARTFSTAVDLGNQVFVTGGYGAHYSSELKYFNDVFFFTKENNFWKQKHTGTYSTSTANFGTTGVYDVSNVWTGSQRQTSTKINEEEIYLFGGIYFDESTGAVLQIKNQLWGYNITMNAWKFICGDKIDNVEDTSVSNLGKGRTGETNIYSSLNQIGARGDSSIHFLPFSNELLVFGGHGWTSYSSGLLNDVWLYSINLNQWKFYANDYSKSVSQNPIFGDNSQDFDHLRCIGSELGFSTFLKTNETENNYELFLFFGYGTLGANLQSLNNVWRMDLFDYCNEIKYNNPNVCSGKGSCISHDNCKCNDGYYGEQCTIFKCFEEFSNSSSVCNNNGICRDVNECACFSTNNFQNLDCSKNEELEQLINNIWVIILIPSIIVIGLTICCIISWISFFVLRHFQKRVKRLDKIDDIELILQEAEIEQEQKKFGDGSIHPKIKINKKLFEVEYKDITLQKLIGSGGSNTKIYKALYKGVEIAYKAFRCDYLFSTDESFEEFEKEVEIFSSIIHPYCLKFYGACINPPKIGILMKICKNGDLLNFIKKYYFKNNKKYPINEKIRILNQISNGMAFLHSKNLIHRDLKPENILIDNNENVQIMDYGLSKLKLNSDQTMTKKIGTSYYMAPEVIVGPTYSFPSDVYSFAILMLVVITENSPYGNKSNESEVLSGVSKNPNFRPKINKNDFKDCLFLIDLIEKNWNKDPLKRNTFSEICQILTKQEQLLSQKQGKKQIKKKTKAELKQRIEDLEREVKELKLEKGLITK